MSRALGGAWGGVRFLMSMIQEDDSVNTKNRKKVNPTPLHPQPYMVQWFRGGLVFEAHRLLYHSA